MAAKRALVFELDAKVVDTDSRRVIIEGRVGKLEAEIKAAQVTID